MEMYPKLIPGINDEERGIPVYVVIKGPTPIGLEDAYHGGTSKKLGNAHLSLSIASIFLGACLLINCKDHVDIQRAGAGLWSGAIFAILGLNMALGAARKSYWSITITLIFGIVTSLTALSLCIFSGAGITSRHRYHNAYYEVGMVVWFNVFLIGVGVVEFVLGIISTGLACRALCCRGFVQVPEEGKVIYTPNGAMNKEQLMDLAMKCPEPSAPSH